MSDTADHNVDDPDPDPTPDPTTSTETVDPVAAARAETERWKAQARENEKRAKANAAAAKELEQVRQQSMSEAEKAVEIARAETRQQVLVEMGSKLVAAELRAALSGLVDDPAVVIEDLNLARFITDDGEPDRKAIDGLAKRYAQLIPKPGVPKVPTGARSENGTPGTFSRDQLRDPKFFEANQAEIMRAAREGRITP